MVTGEASMTYTQEDMENYEAAWMERVAQYLAALEDLTGMAQDEEGTSTPEEAIGWADAQFRQIFKITTE